MRNSLFVVRVCACLCGFRCGLRKFVGLGSLALCVYIQGVSRL